MSKFKNVKEFNEKIINLETMRFAKYLPMDRVLWFKKVLLEELDEFEQAWSNGESHMMLDALIDMVYFILGRVYECGFTEKQWDKAFELVHEANMKKQKGDKGRGSDKDAVKDENWQAPDEDIAKLIYGIKEEKPAYDYGLNDEDNMAEIKPNIDKQVKLPEQQHHEPSIYLEDGTQKIVSVSDINLFTKMSPVFKEVTEIALRKAKDYNGEEQPKSRSNYFPFGLISYAQMIHTKSQRLNSLAKQATPTPVNESVRDTLLDLINYATFAVEALDKGEV